MLGKFFDRFCIRFKIRCMQNRSKIFPSIMWVSRKHSQNSTKVKMNLHSPISFSIYLIKFRINSLQTFGNSMTQGMYCTEKYFLWVHILFSTVHLIGHFFWSSDDISSFYTYSLGSNSLYAGMCYFDCHWNQIKTWTRFFIIEKKYFSLIIYFHIDFLISAKVPKESSMQKFKKIHFHVLFFTFSTSLATFS